MMVHASDLAFLVGFGVEVALDGDGFGLDEQVRIYLLANFDRELLEVAGIRRVASEELSGRLYDLRVVSSGILLIQMFVRLIVVVLQWRNGVVVSQWQRSL